MDSEVVKRAKAGDTGALEEIYNETRQMVYFTALGIVKKEDDAEDVVQDTYMKAFENLPRLQEDKAFPKWLKTIVIHISKNYLKKCKPVLFRDDEQEDAVIGSAEEISEDFLPQEYLEQTEKQKIIQDMVFGLPDAQRIAVILYYYDELPLSEVSKVMETADGTTKSRLNYARKQIKAKVDEQEKQGNKLYVGVPMLTRILHMVSQRCDLPAEAAKHILSNSLRAANVTVPTASSTAAGSGAAQAAAGKSAPGVMENIAAAGKPAAKGLLAKIAGMSVKTRVISLISAAVLLAGGGTGIAVAVKQHNDAAQAAIVMQQNRDRAAKAAAAKTKQEAAKAAVSSRAASSSSQAAAPGTLSEQDRQLYKAFYNANFEGTAKGVFFADLTHDGRDEMLVTYLDNQHSPESGVLAVYTIRNGTVAKIFERPHDVSHSGIGAEYLYRENGLDYIFEPFDLHPNAYGDNVSSRDEISYWIIFFDENGKQKTYKSDSYADTIYMDGRIEYAQAGDAKQQKQHQNAVYDSIKSYTAKSKLLFKAEWGGDIIFGDGVRDPFGESSAASDSSGKAPSSSSQAARSSSSTADLSGLYTKPGVSWTGNNQEYEEAFDFEKDGTMDYDYSYNSVNKDYTGTYQVTGDKMTMNLKESKYNASLKKDVPIANGETISPVYTMKLEDGEMTLTLISGTPMSKYQKVGETVKYDKFMFD